MNVAGANEQGAGSAALRHHANDEFNVAPPTPHPGVQDIVNLDVPVEEIPALLVKLAAAQAGLQVRLLTHRAMDRKIEESETLLESKGVAEWLGVKEDYVRDLGRRGAIPTVKIGKYVRFERGAVREWIARQRESIDGGTARRLLGRR